MSGEDLYLSITPLKLSGKPCSHRPTPGVLTGAAAEIPAESAAIKAGREVLESTATWKKGKSYQKNTVRTCSRPKGPKDGTAWYCRVSEHGPEDATFDEFWAKLGQDKAENEMQYVVVSVRGCVLGLMGRCAACAQVHPGH